MAARALKSIRLCTLVLCLALAPAKLALAGDVSVQLDAGTGFSIKNSTGAIERLRVDEATGNISRNGALFVHTTGQDGIFLGGAGNTAITGIRNVGIGKSALASNTTGQSNTGVGTFALLNNTTGSANSAIGFGALGFNTSGSNNAALGLDALHRNTTGSFNTAVGMYALYANTNAGSNSAMGFNALRTNTTGYANSALGDSALFSTTDGPQNSAFGAGALRSNTTGAANSGFGSAALQYSTTGNRNAGFGQATLRFNTTGSDNAAFGRAALYANNSGSRNVAIGSGAGNAQTTGNDNIYLANAGVAGESGQIKIGTAGTHTKTTIAGIRGVTTANANAIPVLIDSNGQLGTVSSSRRVKKDIRDMGESTARLLELRPVTFRYKQEQMLPDGRDMPPEYGLIAEEVAEVFPDLVVYDEKGQPFTVKYHEMAPMLLNEAKKDHRAIGEQQRKIDQQAVVIEQQRQENEAQQREIASLTTRLARVETQVSAAPH
jgi:hypothetical protein